MDNNKQCSENITKIINLIPNIIDINIFKITKIEIDTKSNIL